MSVSELRHIFFRAVVACVAVAAMCSLLPGCASTKHVPDGEMLLESVDITVDNDTIDTVELYNFLRQTPNHKVLGFAKLQLGTYSLSGSDTTKWYNRWLRNIGQPPVIFDAELTEMSRRQLRQALINRGYMDVTVEVDSTASREKKKIEIDYHISAGSPHVISSLAYNIPDSALRAVILADSASFGIRPGDLFDRNRLDNFRTRITTRMRNLGYYSFNNDYITFTADTVRGSKSVALTMNVKPDSRTGIPEVYKINRVIFVTDYNPALSSTEASDTVDYRGVMVLYGPDRYIKPSALEEKCYLRSGMPYSARAVERTYEALSQLGILKFINIEMRPAGTVDGTEWLDAYILLSRNKKQAVTVELEGTNSEGDLGFGVGLTYQHRNLAKGSELLTAKFRTNYESLSGKVDGLINNRYSEYAAEVGITFPKFKAPFLSSAFKKRMRASTEFSVSGNYQERPEYTRVIFGAAWKYKWSRNSGGYNTRRTFDLVDVNYVRLPKSTLNFLDSIAPSNPLLRYSYEDHFIMRMGYTFYRTNRRIPTATMNAFVIQPSVTTFRASAEMAGNLLYALSSAFDRKKSDGAYKVFGIQYAQYVKAEADFTYTRNLNSRNALSFHIGAGIGVPYGNSSMIPFEKRFYAGGANGVRGWGVRTLGPGAYDSRNSVTDFINQCGDIRLDLSVEYRARLFWVFEGALFIDAGNIWTIRDYENQPGGVFKFNEFYKQIAAAYGVGLRMDFTYFLLRFDLGMKAHNPAMNQEPWPLIHPRWGRDATFHFSVGYPF